MTAPKDGQNMPCWYYEKADLKKTPSFHDGINAETEARYRREGPRFIFDMGTKLGLHHDTIATGIVFFHRFYMFHSFKKFPRHITATCCLFLAGKVEETPKKCKDLIKVARSLLNDTQFAQFGDDHKEEVLTFEKVLLQTIKFDLTVEHPYKYMLQYAKALKGERSKIEKLVQMSWTFINDSLSTSLCLQWEPQIIAVAVMYLAGRLCKFEPQDWAYNRGRWWEQFIDDISIELLEDICHQVLDQYSHAKGGKTGSSSKTKREHPKTPGDGEKTEPQAKSSRSDVHKSGQKQKPPTSKKTYSSSHSSASTSKTKAPKEVQRHNSSNTEVVAMDTVDTADTGGIEQGKPPVPSSAHPQTPTKPTPPPPDSSTSLYNSLKQYQSFMGTADPAALSFLPPGGSQYTPGQSYIHQYGASLPSVQGLAPQTPPLPPPPFNPPAGGPPPPPNFPGFALPSRSIDAGFPPARFPHTPPDPGLYPPPPFGAKKPPPTGLATVRITGRRDQPPAQPWP